MKHTFEYVIQNVYSVHYIYLEYDPIADPIKSPFFSPKKKKIKKYFSIFQIF